MKSWIAAGVMLAFAAPPALAQNYVTIEMETDIDAPADVAWASFGDYCDIGEWGGIPCEITSGEGGVGTVRSLADGRMLEILVAQTPLSYGYTQPVQEGRPYDLYHGFMEVRPVTEDSSKLIYTLMYDGSTIGDDAAIEADMARRRGMFEGFMQVMKESAEAAAAE